jgi:HK97 family phage prohead protease
MAKKKQPMDKVKFWLGVGEVKMNDTGNGVLIEGFANKRVVDRGNDLIAPDAWQLDNYKKNPIILYNHGFDPQLGGTPVGKAVDIKPTEDGLYIKAELSKLDDPLINRIRGLVKEKILRAFSVGFNPLDGETDTKSGVNTITKAELYEVSIVGVPMNQDSLFDISSKSMPQANLKGAWLAAAVQNAIYEKEKNDGLKKEDIISAISDKAGLDSPDLTAILAGMVTPVPEEVLGAFSEILGLGLDELKKLDAGDVEVEKAVSQTTQESGGSQEQTSQDQGQGEGNQEGKAQTTGDEDSSKEGDGKAQGGASKGSDFQQCVSDKIRKLIDEGKDQDQAVAIAINVCGEKGACTPMKKDYEAFFSLADDLFAKKQATQDGVSQVTVEGSSDRTEAANDNTGSPMLDVAKQTNVLLGALISEVQAMSKKLDGLVAVESQDQQDQQQVEDTQDQAQTQSQKAGVSPTADMSEEELKAALEGRSKEYGIEILKDASLTFPSDYPTDLSKYADPVNLKYPVDTVERANDARARFKQSANEYSKDESKAAVHNRIVSAQLELGADPSYDEKDPLDAMLSQELKDKLSKLNAKALDGLKKRLDNMRKRLENL